MKVCRLFKRECHILQSRQRIEEGVALKEETATPTKLCARGRVVETQRTPVKADQSRIRLHDVCQALKEDRLAGSAGTKQRKDAAAHYLKSDSRKNHVVVKALVQSST